MAMAMNRVASSLSVAALVVLALGMDGGRLVHADAERRAAAGRRHPGAARRLQGKVLLIDFWASWCVPCKTSFPALDAIFREYRPRGLEVLAVNLDEERRHADAFLSAHPHQMTVLFDPKGAAPLAFGVKGMPTSFLIDKTGTIRFTHMGYSGNVDVRYRQEIAQLLSEQ